MSNRPKVFISYAREDYSKVQQLYNKLTSEGYKPWIDQVDLPKGADQDKGIRKAVRESDLFIVCLSRNSVAKRSFIQKEINWALDEWEKKLEDDLYIFPVRLEDCVAPDRISQFNATDLFRDNPENEWQSLLVSLNLGAKQLGKIPLPPADATAVLPASLHELVANKIHRNFYGMEFVQIPAGRFMMGSKREEIRQIVATLRLIDNEISPAWFQNEIPQHQVKISQFYLGRCQVTQGQWQQVMGTQLPGLQLAQEITNWAVRRQSIKAGLDSRLSGVGFDQPMYYVNWAEATKFIAKLNKLNDGFFYRLPTEAEWEYACRAGTTGHFAGELNALAWFGDNSGYEQRNSWAEYVVSGGNPERYRLRFLEPNCNETHIVGTKIPNAWELCDMHGNVWEWCEDWYSDYEDKDQTNPMGASRGQYKIVRGGAWDSPKLICRSAYRYWCEPGFRGNNIGFRVAASPKSH